MPLAQLCTKTPSLKKLTAGRCEIHSPPLGHTSTSMDKTHGLRPPPQNKYHRHEHGISGQCTLSVYIKTNSLNWLESVWSKGPRTGLKPQHKTVLDWDRILPSLKGCLLWDKWSTHDHCLHFQEIQEFALLERSTRLHREELRGKEVLHALKECPKLGASWHTYWHNQVLKLK